MTTLSLTFAANTQQGAQLRMLANRIREAAADLPDNMPGAAVSLVIDNAPSGASASVQVQSTPFTSSVRKV